jgi:hypothetical protein
MPSPFEILAGFLEKFGDEVEGRESEQLPADVQGKLKELARGSLSESERSQLFTLLNQHPQWISSLAAEVKALRGTPGAKA